MTNLLVRQFRLSPQQARVWALAQASPGFPLGVACVLRLRGPVDGGALRAALEQVVARHEILRTQVRPGEGGEPVQVVAPSLAAGLEVRDLGGLAARDRASLEAAAWQGALAPRSGAEDAAPLRAVLFRRAEDDHVLHLSLPAVCADAATLDALVAEIGAAYAAEPGGGADGADADGEAPLQYADFAAWLHETAAADETGEGRSFWARQPRVDEAALPELWPGVPVHGASGTAVEHRLLDGETARRVDEAAAAHGTDAEAWLLAAWRVVLRRHAGDEAFAVGVAVDGRTFDELRGSPGPFTRSVPVRGEVDGAAPFSALAAATGDALAQARAWQEAYEWPAANGHGPPHLRFGFDWTALEGAGRWGGVEWSLERRWHQTERFGLRLSAERVRGGLRLSLAYDAAAVPAEGAARLLRRYSALLQATLADPAAPADALPLMDTEEQAEALGAGIAASFAADEPLHRRFERQAAATPDSVAVTFDGDSLTYAALDARANRIGHQLRGLGVRPESRVGLCLERGMDAVAGILGILKAGGAYVPMDPAYPAERLRYVMRDAGIRVLLTHQRLRENLPAEGVDVVCLDSLAEATDAEVEADGPLEGGAEADSLAYIIYTSGSTGRPKGVQVTHANVSRLFASTEARFGFGADDVWTMFHSLSFDFSVWELWGALLYGGCLVVIPFLVSRSPADFRALLAREGVTVLSQTPSAFRQLIAADEGADSPLALRWVVFGGEALEPAALRPWVQRHGESSPTLVNMYGITETTVHVTHRPLTRDDVERGGRSPVGVPLADLAVHVLDARLAPVPPAIAGEMFVGGAGVARGYLGRPGLTAERFVPDPFSAVPGARMYRSGDRARRLPGGDLEFLGRADEQVKIRGFRIEPGEIEAVLRSHASVADAAVVAREDVPGEKRLVAYVVPAGDAHPAAADLRAHAGAALPEYMVPAAFVVLDRLPLTPNGKLDRRAFPAPGDADVADEGYVAPRTTTEEVLAAIWAEVLGLERVGIDDNYFAVGGDSILSVRIAARAREHGVELQVADLFNHPTVRALAERVALGSPEAAALDAILRRDRRPFDLISEEDRALLPEDAEDAYPLASLQAGMLYHQALSPGAPTYHNVDSFQFRGRFGEAEFREAVRLATARQENLRTSIHLAGFSQPLQVVHRHAEFPITVQDIRHLDDDAQERLLAEVREREWRTPVDLARAPLMRMRVHLRADDRFHLTLTENHAINDGWSLTSLFADVFADQAALLDGAPLPERPRPALRFRDFIELERATMESGESRRFWAERLAGFTPTLLPRDPRVSGGGEGAGTELVQVPLAPEVREGLSGLARSLSVPLKSVLLAAHAKVLALSTGERDVVTGLVSNGRPEVAGGTDVRGLFLNTVPFRMDVGEGSWADLVRLAFRAESELLPHRRYPNALLQREHGPAPLFETAFNLVRFHSLAEVLRTGVVEVVSGSDLGDTSHALSTGARLHPVTGEILLFGFDYRRGVLNPDQARAVGERYRRVLEAMVAHPHAPHDAFAPCLAEPGEPMEPGAEPLPEACLHARFEAQARRTPAAAALVLEDGTVRYGELDERAERLARALRAQGVGPEVRVAVYLERGPELAAALLGVLKAGGVYVPLDPAHPAERIAVVLRDASAPVLVTRDALAPRLPAHGARVVRVDAPAEAAHPAPDAPAPDAPTAERALPASAAYVIYTSGSTGAPKGVVVPHGAAAAHVAAAAAAYGLGPGDRVLAYASVSFDALLEQVLAPLSAGAAVAFRDDAVWSPAQLADAVERLGITVVDPPTAAWHAVAADPAVLERLRARVRLVVVGGETLRPVSLAGWHRAPGAGVLLNAYGPTEGVVTATMHRTAPADARGVRVPVGTALGGRRARVMDARMRPLPDGVPGELCLGGPVLARGYQGDPAGTAARFVPDPQGPPGSRMYRTGDRACRLADGALDFLGRADGQVKIRGFRVEPGEVEAALRRHPEVSGCAVVPREDGPGGPRLVAYVVGSADTEALRMELERTLPGHMVPAAIVTLRSLPLAPSGKVDRGALPAPDYAWPAHRYVAPRTPLETALAETWASVLGVERVGVEESFFGLGGDSILSMQAASRARWAGVEVTPRQIFEHQTVAAVAAAVERAGTRAAPAPAAQGRVRGELAPTPIQAAFFEQRLAVPGHYNQSVLLEVDAAIGDGVLETALAAVLEHHDALRLRFRRTEAGWRGWHADETGISLERVDLAGLAPDARDRAQGEAAAAAQAGLDLEHGPLGRAVLFDRGEEGRVLLLVVHHLAVDGVSWRILREDLERACADVRAGRPVGLPAKTTSYLAWAQALEAYAAGGAAGREAGFWLAQGPEAAPPLPVDGADGGTVADTRTLRVRLEADETRALLHEVPAAYRTQINDVLLCALTEAVSAWTGSPRVRLLLEDHGREEEAAPGIDLTRTVGWFTSVYPLVLDLAGAEGSGGRLMRVKEQLRAVPLRGIGYGALRWRSPDPRVRDALAAQAEPQLSFNYLGQLDGGAPGDERLRFTSGPRGGDSAPENRPASLLDVGGGIAGGCLHLHWTYDGEALRRDTVERLAAAYLHALRGLIAHCREPGAGGRTPSDFPLAGLTQAELDAVAADGVEDLYPLSPLQEGMLFHALSGAGGGQAYQVQVAQRLEGPLDEALLRRVWARVVARHAILRTAFAWNGVPRPLQAVRPSAEVPWSVEDWTGLDEAEQQAALEGYLAADRARGFVLDRAPLMRCALFRAGREAHWFVWSQHHLLMDGWAAARVVDEVFRLYAAGRTGQAVELEAVRPYRDYIAWLGGRDAAAAEHYWRGALAGFGAPTPLAADRPARPGADGRYARRERVLSAELTRALEEAARGCRVTVNTLLQGAWALLLSRYGGGRDVVFGTTVSGRPAELEGAGEMVGLFINTLPVRVRLPGDARVGTWLGELQRAQAQAREHEHAPLVQVQGWSEVPRGTPLFESLFVYENFPVERGAGAAARAGLRLTRAHAVEWTTYPLTLVAAPGPRLHASLAYDEGRFDAATAERMLGHLERVLDQLAARPGARLADVALTGARERTRIVEEWNRTERPFPRGDTLHARFEAQVARRPDAAALEWGDLHLTYAELHGRANRLAHHLRALGVGPDVRVGVLLERGAELIVGILAVLKAGGCYVPLDPGYPPERLRMMMDDCGAGVLVTRARFAAGAAADGVRIVRLDGDADAIAARPVETPRSGATPENLAYVVYTSGSTGRPKGVMVTHRNVIQLVVGTDYVDLRPGDRVAQASNASFDALAFEAWGAFLNGATLVGIPRDVLLSAPALRTLLREQGVTTLYQTTALLNQLSREQPDIFSPLREVLFGGQAADADRVRALLRAGKPARLLHMYGPTETTAWCSWHDVERVDDDAPTVSVGRPTGNQRIYVLDVDLQPLPVGVPGEAYVGGAGVVRGYLGRPGLTAERFVPDPFSAEPGARMYRTGDRLRWTAEGALEFMGRLDAQVKIRGFRIEPGEIESVLCAHAGVDEARVVVREDAPGETRLVAYVVGAAEPEALREHLRRVLPEYMVPSAVVGLDALPVTPNGKLDERALPAPEGASTAEYLAPRTDVEASLAAIWAEVLRVERVGAHDHFFERGGHSLLAMRVATRIREAFGVELPLRALFEGPTLAALAGAVEALRRASRPSLRPVEPADRAGPLPLSFAQERLWFLDRLEPGGTGYAIPAALRLRGCLDGAAVERALGEVVRRHEALRTTFAEVNGVPVQVVHPFAGYVLPVEELPGSGAAAREAAALRRCTEESARPFDLATGPLFRAVLLRLDARDHVLWMGMHHIVSDGWSMDVLHRELSALYAAFHAGGEADLPELPVQYADYAVWQRRELRGEVLERQMAYWTDRLAGAPQLLELPTDHPRPAMRSPRGGTVPVALPSALLRRLQALAQAGDATLFMVLLAAFQLLLSKYSGSEDVVVGSPVAGRTRAETEGLIGFFVNTLALRTDLGGDPDFRETLRRVRQVTLGAYEHPDLPFERLVAELQPERSLGHSPLFQVVLSMDLPDGTAAHLPGLEVEGVREASVPAKFDLTLALAPSPRGLLGELSYSTDLWEHATAARMVRHLERVLEQVADDPERRASALELMDAAERARVVEEWNRTAAPYPAEQCIHQLFQAQAARTPDAVAAIHEHDRLTYAALNARANRLAHHLRGLGVGPEVRVGICLHRGLDLLAALLAVLKAGGAYVPLDPAYPAERLENTLADAGVAAIVTQEALRGLLPARTGVHTVVLEDDRGVIDAASAAEPESGVEPRNLAYLIYTSGSTGRPKGVAIQHESAVAMLAWAWATYSAEELGGMLASTSITFDMSVFEMFAPLAVGGRVIIVENALALPAAPAADEVRLLDTVPSAAAALARTGGIPAGVRTVNLGGEPLPAALVDALYAGGVERVYDLYGPSEDTTFSTVALRRPGGPVTIGRILPNSRAYVLDAALRPVPVGVPGELYLGGRGVTRGYLGRPSLTAERFVPDPFASTPGSRLYRTGDRVRWVERAAGTGAGASPDPLTHSRTHALTHSLQYLGRLDHQAKIRGFRVEPGEVEAALARCAGVRDACVAVREDAPGDRRLVAYVVGGADANDLRAALRAVLPEYMVPAAFVPLDALPLTPNGKVNRRALSRPEADAGVEYVAPRTPSEEVLAEICAELLGVDRVGMRDGFFALGGHSLLVMRLIARVRDDFGVELTIRALFAAPTVEGIAAEVERLVHEEILALSDEELRALHAPVPGGGR